MLQQRWKADRSSDLKHKYDTTGMSLADMQRKGQRQAVFCNSRNRWAKGEKVANHDEINVFRNKNAETAY